MKLLAKNKEEITVKIENLDDLWYLSNIVETGDLVKGKTVRKIKIGSDPDRDAKVVKKTIFIEIKVEKIEFSKTTNVLRLLGVIVQAPEEIQKGEHHSFNLEEGSIITIKKEGWLRYQLDKLQEACSEKAAQILLVVHDREEAFFALMKKYGYELLCHIEGDVQKKGEDIRETKSFYNMVSEKISDYSEKYKIQTVVIASPAFWKDEMIKEIQDENLKRKIISATCSSVGKTAFNEVLKRDEVKKALQQDRITREINVVEELLSEIKKNNLAVYGLKETENAAIAGAIANLLVCDTLIRKTRDEGKYERLEKIMKSTEQAKGKVMIISSEHEGGKKLNGLGGIGAILRYKLNY